jgi:hypothetical protein
MPSAVSMETGNVDVLNTCGNFIFETVPSEGRGGDCDCLRAFSMILGNFLFFCSLHVDFNFVNREYETKKASLSV